MNKAAATFAVKRLQHILANRSMKEIANDYLVQKVGECEEGYESLTDPQSELDAIQECLQFIRDKGMRHVGTADSIVNPLKDILGSSEPEGVEVVKVSSDPIEKSDSDDDNDDDDDDDSDDDDQPKKNTKPKSARRKKRKAS